MGHRTRDVPSVAPAFPQIRESERTTLKPQARSSEQQGSPERDKRDHRREDASQHNNKTSSQIRLSFTSIVNMVGFDMRGLTPAPVTPFTEDGAVDYETIQRLGSWLGGIDGVKGLVVLGHAGEGTFLTIEEQVSVIKAFVKSVENKVPIIAGITGEGTEVAALEAKRAKEAGAAAGLLYPSHGWLRFGYQPGAPQDRYRRVYEVPAFP